jgi:hypothetical protein
MGMGLKAECPCGYANDRLALGAGMADFTKRCAVPARCDRCGSAGTIDYLAGPGRCPSCGGEVISYAEVGDSPPGKHMSWRVPDGELILPAAANVCPRCRAPTLSFAITLMFD